MHNWESWNIGDEIIMSYNDFDGSDTLTGIVIGKYSDHLTVEFDRMYIYVSNFNREMFKRI